MENYLVKINNIDEEDFGFFEIIFTNLEGKKIAQFDLDIDEITNDYEINNFNKLTKKDKMTILSNFIHNIELRKNSMLNFIMSNGERNIKIIDGFIQFKILCVTICCEFVVKINNVLIAEFKEQILNKM